MKIGAMNHPAHPVLDEIAWMAGMGLDFLDLTLEPPAAPSWRVDPRAIRAALEDAGLDVVGHTAYYLPLASPFEPVRKAAVDELHRCLDVFAEVGARWMNIHPDRDAPMHSRDFLVAQNLASLSELLPHAQAVGVGLMVENLPGQWNSPAQLAELLTPLPALGLHLDVGHANLLAPPGTAAALVEAFGPRIPHVHLHDNRGGSADLHLPLGAGSVDIRGALGALKRSGYNGTITLEVFSADRRLVAFSCERLREMWEAL